MTEANDTYQHDAFISYSHKDKEWVQSWLLPKLEEAGLRVCIDFRDFEPGLPSLVNMENAVERSHKTLIVLTPAWVESEWTTFESLLIQTDDPAGRRARMIPLLLRPCESPKRIAMLTYLDFTQESEAEFQLQRLVAAIREDAPPISLPSPQEDKEKRERELVPPEELIQLPEVEVVTPGGRLIRGWLVRTLRSGTVIGVTGLIVAILACVGTYLTVPQVQEFIALRRATPTPTSSPTLTITPTSTPTSTPTAIPPCPVTAATDEETIRALVLAEAERVLEQDLEGVVALFDENALKWDKARNQSWQGKAQIRKYYEDAWRDIVYTQVLHTNIVITVTGTTATARNDSSGTYIDRKTGEVGSWDNPRGDSWTFARGTDGCWLITSHRFNLSPEDS